MKILTFLLHEETAFKLLLHSWRRICIQLRTACVSPPRNDITIENSTSQFQTFFLHSSLKKKLFLLKNEMESLRNSNECPIPDKISEAEWLQILSLSLLSQRKRFYKYLKWKQLGKITNCEKIEAMENTYLLHQVANKIIPPIEKISSAHFYNNNLIHAEVFGQCIVFDMDYEKKMKSTQTSTLVNDFNLVYNMNKVEKEPFRLHFCNFDETRPNYRKFMHTAVFWQNGNYRPLITAKSYLDIFPADRLVYLTPDATEDLQYNQDDIYIIGGLVERTYDRPHSLRKANIEGIKTARLPLNTYVPSLRPSHILQIYKVLQILLNVKNSMDWKYAIKSIS